MNRSTLPRSFYTYQRVLMAVPAMVLMLVGVCLAQSPDLERIAPQPLPPGEPGRVMTSPTPPAGTGERSQEAVLVEALKGIVFVSAPEAVRSGPVTELGITVDGVAELNKADFLERVSGYLGQPVTLGLLDALNRAVVGYLHEQDIPVVDSLAPQGQDISQGVVQILVLVGRLGEVKVEGAAHFPAAKLAAGIRLKTSDTLSQRVLEEDIRWLNNNPFRRVDLVLERGKAFGETDIVLKVDDRLPVRVYGGVDDSGTDITGKRRWFTGVNWGNALGLDHQFNYQFSSSFDVTELNAHSFTYLAPLPWRHSLTLFGAYVDSDPPSDAAGFDLRGKSGQLGLRYGLPLGSWQALNHDLTLGVDFKRSNNDLQFGTLRVFDTFTNVVQFNIDYAANIQDEYGATGLRALVNYSPGGISNDNEDAAFEASRVGASADYVYARFSLNRLTVLPHDFSWALDLQLQVSNANLLGSEQLGIGGYRTVRGYDEYAVVGDEGLTLRNELRTPVMSLLKTLNMDGPRDDLQLLTFVDYGVARPADKLPGEQSRDLLSAGIGLRYTMNPTLTLRADYGWQLKQIRPGDDKDNRLHFSLVFGY